MSITDMTAKIIEYEKKFKKPPGAIYVGRHEWIEIKKASHYYPQSIQTNKIFDIRVFRLDTDNHFGLKS